MANSNLANPVPTHLPNDSYNFSYGWAMANAHTGTTNSVGFTNSLAEIKAGGILVIGDSFIESLMLSYPETLQGRLEQHYSQQVFAVSASANGLADSLQVIDFIGTQLKPSVAVFFIEPGDVEYVTDPPEPGHSGFVEHEQTLEVIHNPYIESPLKTKVLKSALAKYIYYNLKFPKWIASKLLVKSSAAANNKVIDKVKVLNYYFAQIQQRGIALNFKPIFLIDTDRTSIYNGQHNSNHAWLNQNDRDLFINTAHQYQLDVIDMDPVFFNHWEQNHERFDWLPMDGHWNLVAHKLAAEQVISHIEH
jgi:hypothetical protein